MIVQLKPICYDFHGSRLYQKNIQLYLSNLTFELIKNLFHIEEILLLLISFSSKVPIQVVKGVWQKIIRIIQWHYNLSIRLKLTLSTLPLGLWSSGLHQSNSTSVCHGHGHSNNVTRWPATGRESFSLSILHHCKDIGNFPWSLCNRS